MTEEELVTMLCHRIDQSSQKDVARELGISPQYLCDIVHYRRTVGNKVLKALGLRKINLYVEANNDR